MLSSKNQCSESATLSLIRHQYSSKAEGYFLLALRALKKEDVNEAEYYLSQAKASGFLTSANDYFADSVYRGTTVQERYLAVELKIENLKKKTESTAVNLETAHDEKNKVVEKSADLVKFDSLEVKPADQNLNSVKEPAKNKTLIKNKTLEKIVRNFSSERLNNQFTVKDGSRIDRVFVNKDKEEARIVIRDIKRLEEITVIGSLKQLMANKVEKLIPNARIASKPRFDVAEDHQDHSFCHMVDYAVQALGEKNSDHKKRNADNQTFLTAAVVRKNLKDGKSINCIAEYSYYKNQLGLHVMFHRLLRRKPNMHMNEKHKNFLTTGIIELDK